MKPVRTALFAPGIKERVMTKALESAADAVILDLEVRAGVIQGRGPRFGRQGHRRAAASTTRPLIYVRVNAATTGLLMDDLDAVVRPGLAAVLLSKAENVEDVQQTAAAIDRHESQRSIKRGSAEIILQIENAFGVYNCFNLIKASPRVAATCFGSARDGDLQTDLAAPGRSKAPTVVCALQVLLDSRAAGSHILPLDGVFSDLSDEAG